MINMNSHTLFSFRPSTTNKDYLSLYKWVERSENDTCNIDTINFKDSMSGILSKIAVCPALRMNKDKNQLSSQENIECNALYLQLLENISDVFMKMPNYILKQLPGFTEALYNELNDVLNKLKRLQNKDNASTTKTLIKNNHYNIQKATIKGDLNATTNLNYISYSDDVLLEEDNIKEEPVCVTNNANNNIGIIITDDNDFSEVDHSVSTSNVENRLHTQIDPFSDQINHIYGNEYTENVERYSVTNNANNNIGIIITDDNDFSEVDHSVSTSNVENRLHTQIDPFSDQINHIYGNGYTENVERYSVTNNANTNTGIIITDDNDFSEVDHSASTSNVENRLHTQIDPFSDQINHIYGNGYTENVERHSVTNDANTNIGIINTDDNDFSEVDHSALSSYAHNKSHSHINASPDQINHSSDSGRTRNVEPGTIYEQTIDNSAYFHDHIYLNSTLRNKFRLQNFREKQIEAINAARFGHNCFIVMPSEAGKSLCYQMPAILSAGVTVVVSPLTSLIHEQIQILSSLKIKAAHLAGKLGKKAETLIYNELSNDDPDIKLLYVTPEKLMKNNEINELLASLNNKDLLTRFVIDEAQCVLQWGVGYRMAYSILQELRAKFEIVPITVLTSCATDRTIEDIQQQLRMSNSKIFRTSLNRPKISYNISKKDEINDFDNYVAVMIMEKYPRQSGILYCLTRKKCEEMAKTLEEKGITATAYHSNLSEKTRKKAESDWILNNCYVICATTSYCIGINKPDVRFIVYYSLPPSIEGYYRGTGCAGRDGKDAECHLFYSQNDIKRHVNIFNFNNSDPDLEKIKENRQRQLTEMYEFCINEHKCRRLALLEYFKEKYNNYDCGIQHACDVCRNNMETVIKGKEKILTRYIDFYHKDDSK